jgi:RNA-directed DNA polymerase
VVEADIQSFFDRIDHDQLMAMLERRIDDKPFLRLIHKWLKAGVLEPDGAVVHPVTGTPQGGVVSPVLANIYLHCPSWTNG